MTMAERAESTQKAEVWRLEGGGGGWRLGGAEANFAGDGVDVEGAAAGPDACAERMFALLFDDDGNVGLDLAGDGVGGEMECRIGRNAELHGAGGGLEIPIAGGAGIALHIDAARRGVRFHVAGSAFDAHGAAGGGRFDASAGPGDLRGAGKSADADIALDVGDGHGAGSAVCAEIVADVVGANGTADAERTIEAAGGGRSHGAAGASQSGEEQRERDRYGEITTLHYSSARVQANPAPVY